MFVVAKTNCIQNARVTNHSMFKFFKKNASKHLSGGRPFRHPLFFIFVAPVSVYIFLQTHIGYQIHTLNNFPLPIISYKFLSLAFPYDLFFLYDLNFPFYNYVSKIHFVALFVTRKNMYTKFFSKIKKKTIYWYFSTIS